MKKLYTLLSALLLILAVFFFPADAKAIAVYGGDYYSESHDLHVLSNDAEIYEADGKSIMTVPLRLVCEYLGAEVHWQSPQVIITFNNNVITMSIGSKTAYVNGEKLSMEAAPYLKNNRTMIGANLLGDIMSSKIYARYSTSAFVHKMPLETIDAERKLAAFDLALAYRFDYLPAFSAEEQPDLCMFLMYIMWMDDVWLEDADEWGVISKAKAEEIAQAQFGMSIKDMYVPAPDDKYYSVEFGKYWEERENGYWCVPMSYNQYCLYDLIEEQSYEENGVVVTEATFLECVVREPFFGEDYELDMTYYNANPQGYSHSLQYIIEQKGEKIEAGMSVFDAAREMISEGKTDMFEVGGVKRIKYYLDENGGIHYLEVEDRYSSVVGNWSEK